MFAHVIAASFYVTELQRYSADRSVDKMSSIDHLIEHSRIAQEGIETRSLHIPITQYTESAESVLVPYDWGMQVALKELSLQGIKL